MPNTPLPMMTLNVYQDIARKHWFKSRKLSITPMTEAQLYRLSVLLQHIHAAITAYDVEPGYVFDLPEETLSRGQAGKLIQEFTIYLKALQAIGPYTSSMLGVFPCLKEAGVNFYELHDVCQSLSFLPDLTELACKKYLGQLAVDADLTTRF